MLLQCAVCRFLDEEAAVVQAQYEQAGELAQAAREAALGLEGQPPADKIASLYTLLAGVSVADAGDGDAADTPVDVSTGDSGETDAGQAYADASPIVSDAGDASADGVDARDVDAEALVAFRGEATTSAGVSRAFALAAAEAGLKAVEVTGANGSTWCMVDVDGAWRHVDPAAAEGASDASWLMLTDDELAQRAPDAAPWALADGGEAPRAEAQQDDRQADEDDDAAEGQQADGADARDDVGGGDDQQADGAGVDNDNEGQSDVDDAEGNEGNADVEQVDASENAEEIDSAGEATNSEETDSEGDTEKRGGPEASESADEAAGAKGRSAATSSAKSLVQTLNEKPGLAPQAGRNTGTITLNGGWQSYMHEKDTMDLLTFRLTKPGLLKITIQTEIGNTGCVLYDEDESVYLAGVCRYVEGSSTSPATRSNQWWLASGKYAVQVFDEWRHYAGKYRLKVDFSPVTLDEREPNATFDDAQYLEQGATIKAMTSPYSKSEGYVDSDTDFYRITVPHSGNLRLWINTKKYIDNGGMTFYMNYEIFDAEKVLIASGRPFAEYGSQSNVHNIEQKVKPGTYYIKLQPTRMYSGLYDLRWKMDVSGLSVSPIAKQPYTGKAIKPKPTVKLGGKKLKLNTDYTLKYANNVKPGNAKVAIVGKGKYAGSVTVPFKIVAPTANCKVHRQTYGWETEWKKNGDQSGTVGESKRLEGIYLKLGKGFPVSGGIRYKTHIQGIGWEKSWKYNGKVSGTVGKSRRLEAIRIELTGNMKKKYDVYYRVHAQQFGWMGWAKNGAPAGTEGYSYRLEAIQIVLVPKGGKAPASTLKGASQGRVSTAFQKR
ncbi:MAG: hypothetical protein IKG21_07770 [Atopobiaceae bacterium]|nr:hypothetical protein [Atopobiaceae bacterium]